MSRKNPGLHNLSSQKYTPNRKFVRHRRLILRRMSGGMLDDFESGLKESRRRGRKIRRTLPTT